MSLINVPDANPRRGVKHERLAVAFARAFPIGTRLTNDDFDRWAEQQGHWTVPPPGTPKQSDAWQAHLQRRHQLKAGLNTSLAHPRMNGIPGIAACVINQVGMGIKEVQSVTESVIRSRLPRAVETLTSTHRRRLIHFQQSADWNTLPAYEKVRAEEVVANIDDYANRLDYETASLTNRINRLLASIQQAVDAGRLISADGGIPALLAPVPEAGDPLPDDDETGED
jgi:hypothetical protein